MRLIIILVLAFNSMADLKPVRPKPDYVLDADMTLIKQEGDIGLTPNYFRKAQYLYEHEYRKHYLNYATCKGTFKNLICKDQLVFSDTEYMIFTWRLKNRILRETLIYRIDNQSTKVIWKGKIKRSILNDVFQFDLTGYFQE